MDFYENLRKNLRNKGLLVSKKTTSTETETNGNVTSVIKSTYRFKRNSGVFVSTTNLIERTTESKEIEFIIITRSIGFDSIKTTMQFTDANKVNLFTETHEEISKKSDKQLLEVLGLKVEK